jgi:hypothetical protein
MPFPIVLFFIAERSPDPPLGRTRVGAGGKNLADHRYACIFSKLDSGSQSGQAGTDDNGIKMMFHKSPLAMEKLGLG